MTIEMEADDKITDGIRHYEKFRAAAQEAIDRCRQAQDEAQYYRGQNEMLLQQQKAAEARARELQKQYDELDLLVSALGEAVLSIVEKRRQIPFRKAGATHNAAERTAAAVNVDATTALNSAELRGTLRALASHIGPAKKEPVVVAPPPAAVGAKS